jgi:hypothetical protein
VAAKFNCPTEFFVFGGDAEYRDGLTKKINDYFSRSIEEECMNNEDGKWAEHYKYVVEQPAVETVLDPNNPIRYYYISQLLSVYTYIYTYIHTYIHTYNPYNIDRTTSTHSIKNTSYIQTYILTVRTYMSANTTSPITCSILYSIVFKNKIRTKLYVIFLI